MSQAIVDSKSDLAPQVRKPWIDPQIILSEMRDSEGHVTRFTDGTSHGVPYGS